MLEVVDALVCSVARVVLEKLMERPVGRAKPFRIVLREAAAAGEAAATINVSSAYWKVVGGRCEKIG